MFVVKQCLTTIRTLSVETLATNQPNPGLAASLLRHSDTMEKINHTRKVARPPGMGGLASSANGLHTSAEALPHNRGGNPEAGRGSISITQPTP